MKHAKPTTNWTDSGFLEAWIDSQRPVGTGSAPDAEFKAQYDFFVSAARDTDSFDYGYVPLTDLRSELTEKKITPETSPDVFETITFMQRFDRMSMYLQSKHRKHLRGIIGGALLFLLCYEIYAHLTIRKSSGWSVLPLVIGIVCLWYSIGIERSGRPLHLRGDDMSKRTQIAYLDSRCISEMGRILVFWRLNGVNASICDALPRPFEPRLQLVQGLVGEYEKGLHSNSTASLSCIDLTQEHWELDQARYFHISREKQHLESQFWKEISTLSFSCGLIGIAGLIVAGLLHFDRELLVVRSMLTLAPSLIVISAIVEFYIERRGFEPNVARYMHAEEIFRSDVIMGVSLNELTQLCTRWLSLQIPCVLMTCIFLASTIVSVQAHAYALSHWFGAMTVAAPVCAALFYAVRRHIGLTRCVLDVDIAEKWKSLRKHTGSLESWREHVLSVGIYAFSELVQWYISSSDRIITMPKG